MLIESAWRGDSDPPVETPKKVDPGNRDVTLAMLLEKYEAARTDLAERDGTDRCSLRQHFNAIAEHLQATLMELKVDKALIERTLAVMESIRADVLNRKKPAN